MVFRCLAQLDGNLLHCVRARTHLRALAQLTTRKLCPVGMRNVIPRNHLNYRSNEQTFRPVFSYFKATKC